MIAAAAFAPPVRLTCLHCDRPRASNRFRLCSVCLADDAVFFARLADLDPARAARVALLDLARQEGTLDVSQSEILRDVGSEGTRLSELFREGDGRRAWMTLIILGEKPGSYRLAENVAPPTLLTVPQAFRHSPDYREINWHGYRFRFSKTQAAVVDLLHLADQEGNPGIHQSVILQRIGSEATRLVELFRRADGARAWGLLIVQGDDPNTYRLADSPPAEDQP